MQRWTRPGAGTEGVVRDDVCGDVPSDLHDSDLAALGQRAAVRTELMGEVSNVNEQWGKRRKTCLVRRSDDVVVFDALYT